MSNWALCGRSELEGASVATAGNTNSQVLALPALICVITQVGEIFHPYTDISQYSNCTSVMTSPLMNYSVPFYFCISISSPDFRFIAFGPRFECMSAAFKIFFSTAGEQTQRRYRALDRQLRVNWNMYRIIKLRMCRFSFFYLNI